MPGTAGYRRCSVLAVFCFALFCATCHAQSHQVTCFGGDGSFSTRFRTGVEVHVAAAKKDGFAVRACDVILASGGVQLTVASGAAVADLDAFGVDLGTGGPIAAFQVQESNADCCFTYKIYSLQKPIHLLRTITGGSFFSASDRDLDGRVEIWTDDALAVQGFENLTLGELDFAPPVVLRFVHDQLLDVGSEFQLYFDGLITTVIGQLSPQDLLDFRASDGKLRPTSTVPVEYMHHLRRVKIKVLEIVWAYLYSGREEDAWKVLVKDWPASDVERIRSALIEARKNGIRAQVDGVSSASPPRKKRHASVFDITFGDGQNPSQVAPPQPILIREPPPPSGKQGLATSEKFLDLLIDSAGKIQSAEAADTKLADAPLTQAAMEWKFIPAFSGDRPVACRLRFAIASRR